LDELEGMLLEPRTTDRGFFKPEGVRRLFSQHRAKQRDHGNRIWRLLNLEIWQRVFIDGEPFGKDSELQPNAGMVSARLT